LTVLDAIGAYGFADLYILILFDNAHAFELSRVELS